LVSSFASIFVSVSRAASADIDYPSRVVGVADRKRIRARMKTALDLRAATPPQSTIAVASYGIWYARSSLVKAVEGADVPKIWIS
jgi:hypothetical protein